jgi:lysophospholipase L1-like esterase
MLYRFFCICLIAVSLCACNRKEKVLVIVRGDSFADGIGSSGTTSSATFYQGKQVQGDSTWGKQLQRILDKRDDYSYEVDMVGFPGQTAAWFIKSGELTKTKKTINDALGKYKYIVYCSEFGTNEASTPGVNDNTSVDSLANNIRFISKQVRSFSDTSSTLFVIAYPLTRRVDKYMQPGSNDFRNRYNTIIRKTPKAVGADLTMRFDACPNLYSDKAPYGDKFNQQDVDKLKGVHLNDAGYYQLAQMTADGVLQLVSASNGK